MSMVIEAAAEEMRAQTRALPIQRRRRWISTALAGAAAAALGFLVFRLAWHDPNRPLVADLAVIDNIDIYSQFENVSFLRDLHAAMNGDLEDLSGDALDLDARRDHFVSVAKPTTGREWLHEINDDARANLLAKYNRFRELPEPEQRRMRELHASILSQPDAAQLERTMLAYEQWLGGLSPVRQFELRNTSDIENRIVQIKKWAGEMRDDELLTLTDQELNAFFEEMRGPIRSLRSGARVTLRRRTIARS